MADDSRPTDRGRPLPGVAAFGLVLALVGAVLWFRQEPPADVVSGDAAPANTGSDASPIPPPAKIARWRPGAPRSITIDRLAERLFSQEVPGRLVLITCEDWDGTAYRSNVVVTAQPVE